MINTSLVFFLWIGKFCTDAKVQKENCENFPCFNRPVKCVKTKTVQVNQNTYFLLKESKSKHFCTPLFWPLIYLPFV